MFYFFLLAFELLLSNLIFADKFATTEDGKKVILKDDGTWEYVKEEAKNEDSYDFRSANWGMNKEKVKQNENNKLLKEDENSLMYMGKINEFDCAIGYIFVEDQLVRAKYVFIIEHSNRNDFIQDYDELKEILIKKYGKPVKDSQYWKNDLYKKNYQEWGFAISLGHLIYQANWETPNTDIVKKRGQVLNLEYFKTLNAG